MNYTDAANKFYWSCVSMRGGRVCSIQTHQTYTGYTIVCLDVISIGTYPYPTTSNVLTFYANMPDPKDIMTVMAGIKLLKLDATLLNRLGTLMGSFGRDWDSSI